MRHEVSRERTGLRILIVRTSAIGDVLHGLPVLNALRSALPQAFLAWLVEGRPAELLRDHPALDELVVLPRRWLKSPSTVWNLRHRLRDLSFDATLDLQGLTKSAVAAWLCGARHRIGFGGRDGRELSWWFNNHLVEAQRAHVIERNLELLTALGIRDSQVRFDLPESAQVSQAATSIINACRLGERFGVINPGAGWPSKLWPAARFAAVARHLGKAHGMRSLVVWAGRDELAWADEIARDSQGWGIRAPQTSLSELAGIARRASLFVASDTGPLHLAAAVGTPCVGLFGPMPAERNGPYGAQHIAVQRVCLQGGSRQRRNAGPASMEAISVDDVATACDTILARGEQAKRSA